MTKEALIILGSPHGLAGASANLGNRIAGRLKSAGFNVETVAVCKNPDPETLVAALDRADIVVVSFPVNWDTLPAGLTEALLHMAGAKDRLAKKTRYLCAISNCGFPESGNCLAALRSVELFADRMGMERLGSMAIGQGGVLGEGKLEDGFFKKRLAHLDRAADCISRGEKIPAVVIEALGKPVVPVFLYNMVGNMNFNRMARRNGARRKMWARPYKGS